MRHNFKNLSIWKRSRRLVKRVYEISRDFPREEKFGLTNQMRRAAVSVPSNIAEGCGRNGDKKLIQFLFIANGSLCELETQFLLCYDLDFILEKELTEITEEIVEIRKMIFSFIKTLR